MRREPTGIKDHRQAFARSLRVPYDAASPIPTRGRSLHGRINRRPDSVELMVSGQFLHDTAGILLLEHDEMPEKVEQTPLLENTFGQYPQWQRCRGCQFLAANCAPRHEPLAVRR